MSTLEMTNVRCVFGEKMMSLINDSDPCKLICTSPGQHPMNKGLVKDGTSCLTGGVCVDGDCVVSNHKKEIYVVNTSWPYNYTSAPNYKLELLTLV